MLAWPTSRFYLDIYLEKLKKTFQDINYIHPLLNQHWHWLSHKYHINAKISRLFKSKVSSLQSKTDNELC